MNEELIVARKEIRQILSNRQLLVSSLVLVLVFGAMAAPASISQPGEFSGTTLDQLGFSLILTLGVFLGYIFSGQAFLREKQEGVIETILCSPLTLRQIWLGKVIGVSVPAYALTLITAGIITIVSGILSGSFSIFSPPVILHLLTVVPAFIAATAGLLGFVQLLLGLRENQLISFGIIILIIIFITITRGVIDPGLTVTWPLITVLLVLALLLLVVTCYLARFLDKEKIVRTIP